MSVCRMADEPFVLSLFATMPPSTYTHLCFSACFVLPGLNTEGLYRVSGNKSEMESMQKQFEQGELLTCNYLTLKTSTQGCQKERDKLLMMTETGAPAFLSDPFLPLSLFPLQTTD